MTSGFRLLCQWDATKGTLVVETMKQYRETNIAINDKCATILSISPSAIYRLGTKPLEVKGKPILVETETRLVCAAVSSNSRIIATGSRDGTVQRRGALTGDVIGEPMYGHISEVTCVAFSTNDDTIVTGSCDGSIIRWNIENGERIGSPLMHNRPIAYLSISGDGTVILSSSAEYGLCCWDAVSGQKIGEFVSMYWDANEIWTNDDCTTIVTCSILYKSVRWWSVSAGGAIHETCSLQLSDDVTACAVDINHGVAAVGLLNGAVGLCDIQG